MIHQSQLFVCPEQTYGISWNICLGRQACEAEMCAECPYYGWQEKGFPGFNPYAGAFTPSSDNRKNLSRSPKKPVGLRVFDSKVKSFLPSDIGLEPEVYEKKSLVNWVKKVYSFI